MTPNDLIHAAPAIAKGAALGAAIPLTGIVKRMLGPAADELAEMWRDKVRLYRYERQLKCLEKAERMARDAGFTPKAVPIKLLFPLLEGSSLEENEELHTMWAALLANAASPDTANVVRPGFIAALKQMAPDEAALLNWIVDFDGDNVLSTGVETETLANAYTQMGFEVTHPASNMMNEFGACVNGLEAQALILRHGTRSSKFLITCRGWNLVQVCRPPKAKQASS